MNVLVDVDMDGATAGMRDVPDFLVSRTAGTAPGGCVDLGGEAHLRGMVAVLAPENGP